MERILRVYPKVYANAYAPPKHTMVYEMDVTSDNGEVCTYRKENLLGDDLISFINEDYKDCDRIVDCTDPESLNPLLWVLHRDKEKLSESDIKECSELKFGLVDMFKSVESEKKFHLGKLWCDGHLAFTAQSTENSSKDPRFFEPKDLGSILIYTQLMIIRHRLELKRCCKCGKLFISDGISDPFFSCWDKEYCERVYEDDKLYRESAVERLYDEMHRKYYTLERYGRFTRNGFKNWCDEALDKIALYRANRLSEKEIVEFLKASKPKERWTVGIKE
jgi:hypothetical protein